MIYGINTKTNIAFFLKNFNVDDFDMTKSKDNIELFFDEVTFKKAVKNEPMWGFEKCEFGRDIFYTQAKNFNKHYMLEGIVDLQINQTVLDFLETFEG